VSRQADSLAVRGTLRTYLGIAPGVGKTYAMLRDARARRRAGTDTVVAYWERHGRPATVAQLGDLEVIPARTVIYRGASFAELDVEAVLDRRPELAVADELAHANLPGERHKKRWQDVRELLASGIDVYTTLNVANIESLGPTVSRITGVRQAEPVPDGRPATPRGWRPNRPGRERRTAGQDQPRVAPPMTGRPATPRNLKPANTPRSQPSTLQTRTLPPI
jgi:K+-sensing histidine kinase KdpD